MTGMGSKWVNIEDVAPGQQPNHATARNPFLNLMPEVLSSPHPCLDSPGCGRPDSGSKPQPARFGGDSFPNSTRELDLRSPCLSMRTTGIAL